MTLAIGLMSGTSLDGIDAVLIDISGYGDKTSYRLIKGINTDYSQELRHKILKASSKEQSDVQQICSLNFELGYEFSKAVKKLLTEANKDPQDIDFIASHGQTIWHNPNNRDSYHSSTLQIGASAVIAYETGIEVVSNFREMDIAAGGEGAPLVPYVDYLLHQNKHKNVIIQNIGGIGNLTYIPKNGTLHDLVAMDTGPGNMMIDYVVNKYFNKKYDDGGLIASKGSIIQPLLEKLLEHPFISQLPPKSTGREQFGEVYIKEMLDSIQIDQYKPEDIVTTFTHFTAETIVYQYNTFIKKYDEVLLAGGGSYNHYLVKLLKEKLKIDVFTMEDKGFDSNFKEAIAFAILGNETINQLTSNVPSATGASRSVILGTITKAPFQTKRSDNHGRFTKYNNRKKEH
ncbi:anhydro-N-acetylmuramic acid kinase AnmK [Haloplasma contractile]|uniref:Anhydro-N-acetylmuramic acid kinase n=1 Tax=Haloplasma contractile SSD-17B TaxID=1033810 RepID=F7PRC7_9MOLU|nr:anhydro-N-acetylmuramic acid kinase AnmK [Haloplasma contractile]ERJ11747.1 Anhydro-N-acetylmuramic acid kinase protein [Haloplasma contractile SSD-17B]